MKRHKEFSFWCYQKRKCESPWAVELLIDAETQRKPAMYFSIIAYHEDIPDLHFKSMYDLNIISAEGFVGKVARLLEGLSALNEEDESQLKRFWLDSINEVSAKFFKN